MATGGVAPGPGRGGRRRAGPSGCRGGPHVPPPDAPANAHRTLSSRDRHVSDTYRYVMVEGGLKSH
eukprot:1527935-Rhodomonas_salina.1